MNYLKACPEIISDPIEIVLNLLKFGENLSGECSCQVLLTLKNGQQFVLGVTDPDVAAHPSIWMKVVPRDVSFLSVEVFGAP